MPTLALRLALPELAARYAGRMTTAAPERSRTRRITGTVIGVILALIALGFAFPIYPRFFVFLGPTLGLAASCTNVAASGTQCSPGFLSTLVLVGDAACLFGFGLPVGFIVVRLILKRRAWYWPLISPVLVNVGFFIITASRGNQHPPVAGS